jgi:dTDP-glucose pyrophosphorylase
MIVIPMAGSSKRFAEAGISKPKWSLNVGKKPMLLWALSTAVRFVEQNERIVLIVKAIDHSTLQETLESSEFRDIEVVTLDRPTNGQAITVYRGIQKLQINTRERLLIWCSDCYIEDSSIITFNSQSNHLILARMDGTQWSFAKTAGDIVLETAEKNPISEQASIGLYNFQNVNEFLNLDFSIKTNKEQYVAPLYNQLIRTGKKVYFTEISERKFYSFGTPIELIQSAERLKVEPDVLLSQFLR